MKGILMLVNVHYERNNQMVSGILGPKLLLVMGCVKLGEKNCVHLPEQTAN